MGKVKGYDITHIKHYSKFIKAEHQRSDSKLTLKDIFPIILFFTIITYFIIGFYIDWRTIL